MVAFGRVVVDDIENDLDARFVQSFDHLPEFLHLLAGLAARGVLVVRRQITDRIVASMIPQSALYQVFVMNKLVHGHEFHSGDPQTSEMPDGLGVRKSRVSSAQLLRDIRVPDRKAFNVRCINHRLVRRCPRMSIIAPIKIGIDHH
jgi:hypothetical protein